MTWGTLPVVGFLESMRALAEALDDAADKLANLARAAHGLGAFRGLGDLRGLGDVADEAAAAIRLQAERILEFLVFAESAVQKSICPLCGRLTPGLVHPHDASKPL